MRDFASRYPVIGHDPEAKPEALPWAVEGMILRGKITGVFGAEKSGKSRLLAWMLADALANDAGGVALEGEREVVYHHGLGRVLYLNAEEREVDVQARINTYARARGYTPRADWNIQYVNAAGMQLQKPEERAGFEKAYISNRAFDTVIVDPLRRIHTGDENDSTSMSGLNNDLRRWSNLFGLTIVVVHHTPKLAEDADLDRMATWSRGTTDFVTLLDGGLFLQANGATPTARIVRLHRQGRFPPQPTLRLEDYGDPPLPGWRVGHTREREDV